MVLLFDWKLAQDNLFYVQDHLLLLYLVQV